MNKTNKILAVIISYNPNSSIISSYNSIRNQVDELIIVDNCTTDIESKKYLEKLSETNKIIYNKQNLGIAKALNQGAQYAIENNYEWLLTLDQDSEFLPNTYNLLLSSYNKLSDKEKIMLIAPKYIERANFDLTANDVPANEDEIIWKEDVFIITSGSLIKTEAFEKVGFFEEKLFIDNVDFDFCFRIKQKGFYSKRAENMHFVHYLGDKKENIHTYNYSPMRRYYMARNSVYLFKKYFFYSEKKMILRLLKENIFIMTVRIMLFEKDKRKKIFSIYKGFFDGIFDRY